MRSFMCACGRRYLLSDVNRCPYCHMDLTNHTDDYARKHMDRCAGSIAPRVYSERRPGRPSRKEVEAVKSAFVRHCRNCGTPRCQGCDEGMCDDWSPMEVERCPFCGRIPVMVEKEGTHAIICDHCNCKMISENRNELICRWNRKL